MRIINVKQGQPAWHQWRRDGISASTAPTLTGRNPYETPWQYWAQRVGLMPEKDLSRNPNVQRGNALEDVARRHLEDYLGFASLLPVCAESTDWPVLRASLDGLTDPAQGAPNGSPVEIKAPGERVWKKLLNEGSNSIAYTMYWSQVQAQILVCGADYGWLFFYRGEADGDQLLFRVDRDQDFLDGEFIPAAEWFWKCLNKGVEPPQDPLRDVYIPDGQELNEWMKLSDAYKGIYSEIKDKESELNALKEKLKAHREGLEQLMGSFAKAEANGVRVVRSYRRGSVNHKKALEEWVPSFSEEDLEPFRGSGSSQIRVTVQDATVPKPEPDPKLPEGEEDEELWFY